MGEIIRFQDIDGIISGHIPNECPICHHIIQPKQVCGYRKDEERYVRVVFECPNLECQELFIGYYIGYMSMGNMMAPNYHFELEKVEPQVYNSKVFEEMVHNVSTTFVEIYNQASSAEQVGLNEICGMGYRKALEFLIKDYLIQELPKEEDNIKKSLLGKCINTYISDQNIKAMASRAVWLGNDETHYVRKWENKDIQDLKKLIDITIYWISMSIMTKQYMEDM